MGSGQKTSTPRGLPRKVPSCWTGETHAMAQDEAQRQSAQRKRKRADATSPPCNPPYISENTASYRRTKKNKKGKRKKNDDQDVVVSPEVSMPSASVSSESNWEKERFHTHGGIIEGRKEVVKNKKQKKTKTTENHQVSFSSSSFPFGVANKTKQKKRKKPENYQASSSPSSFPFDVDNADHCETPQEAYHDILPLLNKISESLGKTPASLALYDPYYCDGSVKRILLQLGFSNVLHEKRDFYKDIQNSNVPDYDVLITNPPYSGDHMSRLTDFVIQQQKKKKISLLLLPNFCYTKDYYRPMFPFFPSAAHSTTKKKYPPPCSSKPPFFLVPTRRYSYFPPSWVASSAGSSTALTKGKHQTAPFPSFWYCHIPNSLMDGISDQWLAKTFATTRYNCNVFSQQHRVVLYARTPQELPREFKSEFDITKTRPNPRARKRAAAKRQRQQQQSS